jgi:hypothetical protein
MCYTLLAGHEKQCYLLMIAETTNRFHISKKMIAAMLIKIMVPDTNEKMYLAGLNNNIINLNATNA